MSKGAGGLFDVVDDFYRAKQTCAASILLHEKNADLTAALIHLCKENGIEITEGIGNLMGEIESLLFRIAKINSLPLKELLRLPPLSLATNETLRGKNPNGDLTPP